MFILYLTSLIWENIMQCDILFVTTEKSKYQERGMFVSATASRYERAKAMRKSKKQLVLSMAACVMMLSMAVGGTMAYMTDSETATNEFTVGKVKIALEEPHYPGNDSEKVNKLVPNEIVKKDPQIKNTGENDAIVFMKVQVPKANITITPMEGGTRTKAIQEIFTLKNLKTGDDGTWMEIRKDDAADDKCIYVFGYKTKLAKDATTTPLFDEVQLRNFIEREIDVTIQDIIINSYAIQANDIADIDTSELDKKKLDEIYEIYVNQSGDKETNTINYVLNGGTLTGEKKNYTVVDYGYIPPTPTKEGYKFVGWDPESIPVNNNGPIVFTAKWEEKVATLLNGETVNIRMKILAGSSSTRMASDRNIKAIQRSDEEPSELVRNSAHYLISTTDSESPIYMWFDNGVIKWWSEARHVMAGSDLSYLCCGLAKLSDISGLADIDTSNVTDMSRLFYVSYVPVTGVENPDASMPKFALDDITPLKTWDTKNVTDMSDMFYMRNQLTNLEPLANWDVSNVKNMRGMFLECSIINNASAINDWDVSNVINFKNMFYNCPSRPEFTKRSGTWVAGTFYPAS